jgi:hypothetical protein
MVLNGDYSLEPKSANPRLVDVSLAGDSFEGT